MRAGGYAWFRSIFLAGVDFLLPGIVAHYLARKRCLEDWLRVTSCRQVVVLGAGLDTLAWRWCVERPGVRFIEVDRPDALRVKTRALGGPTPSNLTFLCADVGREALARILEKDAAFDPAVPTLFIAEGLCMYLTLARVRALFAEIAASGGPRVLAFTFMEGRADGRIKFRRSHPLVDRWLRWQGEPFQWSFPPDEIAGLLNETGWRGPELVGPDALRDRYLTPAGLRDAPLAAGEWLALTQNSRVP